MIQKKPRAKLLGYAGATINLFTEHNQITKAFLDSPERMLGELMRGDA